MAQATQFLQALLEVVDRLGVSGMVCVLGILVGGPILLAWLQKRAIRQGYIEALNAKEQQIQRLADDNRAYRRYFFRQRGMTPEEIDHLDGGDRQTLTAGPSPPQPRLPPAETGAARSREAPRPRRRG